MADTIEMVGNSWERSGSLTYGDPAALRPLIESGAIGEADMPAMRGVLELVKLSGDDLRLYAPSMPAEPLGRWRSRAGIGQSERR